MLQFPAWKVILVLLTLLVGTVMALPNAINLKGAPDWVPKKAVNLGLDLRGGVYLMMEVKPDEVVANRLLVVQRDIGVALDRSGSKERVFHRADVSGRTLTITLTRPDAAGKFPMTDALARINAMNEPVPGSLNGERTYAVEQVGADKIRMDITPVAEDALMKDAMAKAEKIIRRRVDPDGVAEIELTPSGVSRLVLEAPGEPDPERLKALLNRDGRMTFHLVDSSPGNLEAAQRGVISPGFRVLPTREGGQLLVKTAPEIVGSDIATANPGTDEYNRISIDFRLNPAGGRKFFETTRRNVNKQFAIVLDDVVMSAPNIQQAIAGGNVQITGTFAPEEAKDLAAIIAAGEMPAKLQFLDQRVVSSTLGKDSIKSGLLAALVGIAAVSLFMILAYGTMGVFAVISLAFNIVLIFAGLTLLNGTLTLPGIAGIILTVGMAVDANVLVFERIREGQYAGRSPWSATDAGYSRAFVTILDANLTTLLAAFILYFMGAGPVRGFAATLTIGILTSVFTAFVVTRMLTVWYLKLAKPKKLAV